ncbi:MAG TPA: hypothetical protein VJX67_03000 [Blastocatellia bacterium]|nr:hypothetical protein [Blastocatellia bacterium]
MRGSFPPPFGENPCGHPEVAEQVARILYALLEHLGQGPEGLRNARFILKQGLRLTYPFTSSCRLAYRHYRLSLSGYVKPDERADAVARGVDHQSEGRDCEITPQRKARWAARNSVGPPFSNLLKIAYPALVY